MKSNLPDRLIEPLIRIKLFWFSILHVKHVTNSPHHFSIYFALQWKTIYELQTWATTTNYRSIFSLFSNIIWPTFSTPKISRNAFVFQSEIRNDDYYECAKNGEKIDPFYFYDKRACSSSELLFSKFISAATLWMFIYLLIIYFHIYITPIRMKIPIDRTWMFFIEIK